MSSLLLCAAAAGLTSSGTLLALSQHDAPGRAQRTVTFEERVSYQRAIEEVYWRHRIWPKERPDPKPSLDAVISQAQIEKKVRDYLRNSQALADYWQRPITAEQLQTEMDRVAQRVVLEKIGKEALHQILGVSGRISAASKKSVKRRPIPFSKSSERFPHRFIGVRLARLQYDGPMRRLERRTPFLQRSRDRFRTCRV
jgi:hypothetical protein